MAATFNITPESSDFLDAYPCLARLAEGDLLLVFGRSPKSGKMRTGWIAASRSADGGRTWSRPRAVINTPEMSDGDPNIVAWDNHVIVLSTTVPPTHGDQYTITRIMAVRSDDSGRTWSEPSEIPTPYTYVSGKINPGVRFADGTLAFGFSWDVNLQRGEAVYCCDGDSWNEAGVMISADDGHTWSCGRTVGVEQKRSEDRPGAINGLDEPAFALCADGSLYMLMRSGFERLYEARSRDQGRTWSRPRPTELVSHNAPADLCVFEHPSLGRGWFVAYDNSPSDRFPLAAAVSFDEGASWSRPLDIVNRGRQSSYPACVQTAQGDILVAWWQDTEAGRHIEACLIDPGRCFGRAP